MKITYLGILVCLMHPVSPAVAESVPNTAKFEHSQVQLFIENDKFAGSDRYYTNGLKLAVGFGLPMVGEVLDWAPKKVVDFLSQPGSDGTRTEPNIGFAFGQNLYTPKNIGITENQPYDRPWAAWLYLGAIAQRARDNRLDTVELDVGVVGPAALGREVQSTWHSLIGANPPKGWSNQIPNEPAFMIAYLQKRCYGTGYFQIVPHAGVTLGTVFTLARGGAIVRVGQHMTGFGPDTIEPGGAMLQKTREGLGQGGRNEWEWYAFTGLDYRWVARNIFLDGPAFRDGPSVDRRPVVHDLSVGLVFRYGKFNFSATRIFRSEEFTTAQGGGGRQGFSSINVGWQWN